MMKYDMQKFVAVSAVAASLFLCGWTPFPAVLSEERGEGMIAIPLNTEKPDYQEFSPAEFFAERFVEIAGKDVYPQIRFVIDESLYGEEYTVDTNSVPVTVTAGSDAGLWNGAALLLDMAAGDEAEFVSGTLCLPAVRIEDRPEIPLRGIDFQWCYIPVDMETMKRAVTASRMMRMNMIVPEFGKTFNWSDEESSAISHDDMREFLRHCAANGLQVIPKLNSLGHSDRGFVWPVMLGEGLDTGVEENYTALAAEVAHWQRELAAVGQEMEYFHFGMDEASDCITHNVKKYSCTGGEIVTEHFNRIAAICRETGVTGIAYHDMLVGGSEKIYWREVGTFHADKDGTWKARKDISRELIINYWNYEAFNRYRTVEGLWDEGFKILFTPWGGESVRTMAKNAALYGEGLLGSTWCDFITGKDGSIPGNSIYSRAWIRDGICDVAQYGWNGSRLNYYVRPADGGRAFIKHWLPVRGKALEVQSLLDKEVLLGRIPDAGTDEKFTRLLQEAPKPLAIYSNGKKVMEISRVNKPAAFRELTLYTADFGRESNMDIYSSEVRIQNNQVWSQNDWGVGHTLIPRNGFVISGWGEGFYGLPELNVGSRVKITDAEGNDIPQYTDLAASEHPDSFTTDIPAGCRRLYFEHQSAVEGDLSAAPVAEIIISGGGCEIRKVIRYGRDIAADGETLLPADISGDVYFAGEDDRGVTLGYIIELPQEYTPDTLTVKLPDNAPDAGYKLLKLYAEF